jgi:FKBP-type peptidyl-prolyl cis-trans isomerase (trigger factor)
VTLKGRTQATEIAQTEKKGASTFVVLDYSQNVTGSPVEGKVSPNYSTELGGDQDCAQLMATEERERERESFF